jgi:HK97 family phage prohead protease
MKINLPKNNAPEMRSVEAVFAASDDEGVITGRPIVYNSRTDIGFFDEIIESGALNNTNLQDVRFCLNHDTSFVYARSRRNNNNSTMQLQIDEQGLYITARLDIENSAKARDLYSAIKRGDLSGMSFMFTVADDEWENLESDHPFRRIKEIGTVVEVSAVTFPAYQATDINARSRETLESARAAVETARAKSVETDNTLELAKAKYIYFSKNGGFKK